jgi:hypothetical protein
MTRSEALELLKSWGACQEGIDRVKDARTIELMIARASLNDLEWVIERIGGKTQVDSDAATASAWAARDAATDSAWAAYDAATASARAARDAAIAPAQVARDAAIAPARAAYEAAAASAWAAYDAAAASARAAYNAVRLEIARKIVTAYVGRAR